MREGLEPVRNSAKAIIIQDGALLVITHRDRDGAYYTLPGGGQEPAETLLTALGRECMEELGVPVHVGPLRHVREYIGANHEFSQDDGRCHQVEFMFECHLAGDLPAGPPPKPDATQTGVAWLPLDGLATSRLYPKALRGILARGLELAATVYLGDVN